MPVKETIGILSLTFSKFEGICLSYSSTQVATQSGVDLWTSHWKVRERSELKKKSTFLISAAGRTIFY